MMNHTKGKWEAVISHKKDDYIIWAGDEGVFIATTQSVPPAAHETGIYGKQANANLIAAAPELFKALKAMTKLFEERIPYPNNTQRYKQAIKAIAKAEGE